MKTSGKLSLPPPERKNSEKDAERIAGDIAQSIRSGELAPGTRLQSEGKLTERYGSNVYSVRKAVAQLKSQGLLYSVPKFGVFVASRTTARTVRYVYRKRHLIRDFLKHYAVIYVFKHLTQISVTKTSCLNHSVLFRIISASSLLLACLREIAHPL